MSTHLSIEIASSMFYPNYHMDKYWYSNNSVNIGRQLIDIYTLTKSI